METAQKRLELFFGKRESELLSKWETDKIMTDEEQEKQRREWALEDIRLFRADPKNHDSMILVGWKPYNEYTDEDIKLIEDAWR
jgi:hypothetical protein